MADEIENTSPLDLDDDAFAALSSDAYLPAAEGQDPDEDTGSVEEEVLDQADTLDEDPSEEEGEDVAEEGDSDEVSEDENDLDEEEESEEDDESEEDLGDEEATESDDVSEELANLRTVLEPFKANGHEIKVDTVEDVRNLMRMGANYSKKMAGLKPNLKVLKTLENNGLLDPDKINYLIDLDKKNPEAIKKLIQDSKIDLDELDTEEKLEYSPSNHTAGDNEVELDEVFEEIEGTSTYQRTVDLITNKWDTSSKEVLAGSPKKIAVLNQHMEMGVYDRIAEVVVKERALGRINNLSDYEAYEQIGSQMLANGEFSDLTGNQQEQSKPVKKDTKAAQKAQDELKARKRKLKPSKASKPVPKKEFNPLAMDDDEIEKIANNLFV